MNKNDVIRTMIGDYDSIQPVVEVARAFSPSNIALCKYWGKRDQELNLPVNSSLSISLGEMGATAELKVSSNSYDSVVLNQQKIDLFSPFGKRLLVFLNLFRRNSQPHLDITIESNIPIGAGMASSACGFASLICALNKLFGWNLQPEELSILARLGSGSACRSIWHGFVEWDMGMRPDGMDSHGHLIEYKWIEFCIGLVVLNDKQKDVSSRDAMQRTLSSSHLYTAWPEKVKQDMLMLKKAIAVQNFELLGKTAESNALSMHATMMGAWPPVLYFLPETVATMR